jgi:Leucine-rich repeat (LRR) protein
MSTAPGKRKENGDEPKYTLGDVMEYFGKDRNEPVSSVIIEYGIDYLSRNMFQSQAQNIRDMDLDDNNIGKLPVGVFSGLIHLDYLSLVSNHLKELPNGVFSGLSNLRTLHLNDNILEELPEGIFSGLSNLEVLWLSRNHMKTLPNGVFLGLNNLESLSLRNNRLIELPNGIFSGLSNLHGLDLGNNRLETLHDDVFAGLASLRSLYLNNNQLDELPLSIEALTNLDLLDISENPLSSLIQPVFLVNERRGNNVQGYLQNAVKGMRGALRMHLVVS